MSDPDTCIWLTIKSDVAAYLELITVRLDSTTTGDYREWLIVENYVGGAGTKDWDGAWRTFTLSPSGSTADGSAGTFDYSDVRSLHVLIDTANDTFRSITNFWIDVSYFGKGLIATGTSFTFDDIAAIDEDVSNKYGIVNKQDGVYFINGQVTIGDGVNTAELVTANETLAFRDTEITTAATRTSNIAPGTYGIFFSGANTVVTAATMTVLSSGLDENTRPDFEVDTTVTDFNMIGCSINRGDYVVLNDDCVVQSTVFNNCNTVTPALSLFESNTISNSNHVRACEMHQEMSGGTAGNFNGNNFLSNISAATWYAFGGVYTDYSNNYDGNLYDVENSSSDALIINLDGTSNASSTYENPGTVTLVSVTNYTLTNLAYTATPPTASTEVRIYLSGTSGDYKTFGAEIYGVEDVTGGTTTFQYGQNVVSSGHNIVVMIHNIDYETIRYTVDLLGTDTTQQIQQQFDRNYYNP